MFWLILTLCISLSALSCYDIQYTSEGDGVSPYDGQSVTVQGIVSVARFYSGSSASSFGFYICDPQGGPWSGLYVYNQSFQPPVGALVQLSGTVSEYYGFTELYQLTNYQTISTNNPLPEIPVVSTSALSNPASAEEWEGVLVKVQNATVVENPNTYQEFSVTDGSGTCQVDNQCFTPGHSWTGITTGMIYSEITGILDYTYSAYGLNPRNEEDLIPFGNALVLSAPVITAALHSNVTVPLGVTNIDQGQNYHSYSLRLDYNPSVLQYQSYNTQGSLSQTEGLTVSANNGFLQINYSSPSILSGSGNLLNLMFYAANTGVSTLNPSNVQFGDDIITTLIPGSVTVNSSYNAPGDTLTVIQRPLMNIPAIQIPGENMTITCLAPQTASGFDAYLLHGSKRICLPMQSAVWQTNPNRWELQVSIPQVYVFELYDLEVNANGGIHDVSQNAVSVVPSRKTNYYFVHISDLHMPTRIFYPEAGFDADSLAVVDFRAVLDDINLIRPEFVLLTGDLVNEGELEGFAGQYQYGWAQRVLSELEVPVYLTAGNHDIGGWNSTPPSAGSARRSWWSYFGWDWLDNESPTWPYHTQDYYFSYNNTLFIGLESYDNYDYWRQNIYGSSSYTAQQLAWLNNVVSLFPGYTKVLFHHYDFQEQLDLGSLDVDLALWGHIHSNSGSINTQPYNLATRSTCDGNRAYRVIRVNNDVVTPYNTIYAGSTGSNLSVSFAPSNYGVSDTVTATLINGQPLAFENTLLKFIMPAGSTGYNVTNGVIEQIERTPEKNICYVRVNLPANGNKIVSLAANGVSLDDENLVAKPLTLVSVYPNPVKDSCTLILDNPKGITQTSLELYNLKGQKVQELNFPNLSQGSNSVLFRPESALANGIYFLKVKENGSSDYRKVIILK